MGNLYEYIDRPLEKKSMEFPDWQSNYGFFSRDPVLCAT